ncbi:MAG: acyl carrier protein [Veillonellales bacterium]
MEQQEFIQKIREVLFETKRNIDAATVLDDLEGWDSLGRLSLAVLIQESFGVMADTNTLRQCRTVGDIINLVQSNSFQQS